MGAIVFPSFLFLLIAEVSRASVVGGQPVLVCDRGTDPATCHEELGQYVCDETNLCTWVADPPPSGGPNAEAPPAQNTPSGATAPSAEPGAAPAEGPSTQQAFVKRAFSVYELEGVTAATISFLVVAEGLAGKEKPEENAAMVQAGLKGLAAAFELQGKGGGAPKRLVLDRELLERPEAVRIVTSLKKKQGIDPARLLTVLRSSPNPPLSRVVQKELLQPLLSAKPSPDLLDAALKKSRGWSLRDRARRAIASMRDEEVVAPSTSEPAEERPPAPATVVSRTASGNPEYAFEGLEAEAREFFQQPAADRAEEPEEVSLTLFDVVHRKYQEIAERRAATRRPQKETFGMLGEK